MDNKVKPAIISFPGSNCEQDMATVFTEVFGLEPQFIWHCETVIASDITHIVVPGGFSFGDYLRAGGLAAMSPIMSAVKKFAADGKKVLGVCNGFQILCEAQLLPGVLLRNHHDRFICEVVSTSWFGVNKHLLQPAQLNLPIAHREGRYYCDDDTLFMLKENHQIVLSYNDKNADGDGLINGSMGAIGGIVGGPKNNILGMMPHPERMALGQNGRDGCVILEDFLTISRREDSKQKDFTFGVNYEKATASTL